MSAFLKFFYWGILRLRPHTVCCPWLPPVSRSIRVKLSFSWSGFTTQNIFNSYNLILNSEYGCVPSVAVGRVYTQLGSTEISTSALGGGHTVKFSNGSPRVSAQTSCDGHRRLLWLEPSAASLSIICQCCQPLTHPLASGQMVLKQTMCCSWGTCDHIWWRVVLSYGRKIRTVFGYLETEALRNCLCPSREILPHVTLLSTDWRSNLVTFCVCGIWECAAILYKAQQMMKAYMGITLLLSDLLH